MAAKATKIERISYRNKGDAKLTTSEIPLDFNAKVHHRLQPYDFEDETLYLEMKAMDHESKAATYRNKIAILEELGDAEARKAAAKLASLHAQMQKVQEDNPELDIDTILATFGS